MVKRYLGAVLAAFVLGCVGPLTVGAAQAAEEPDDGTSLLGSVTGTLGALTSGGAESVPAIDESAPDQPSPDIDAPEPAPEPPEPRPEPAEPTPTPPESRPEPAEPDPAPAPDTESAGVLGAVTTTVGRLADAPRSLLTGVVGDDTPVPDVPAPDMPNPDAPITEPPADTPNQPEDPEPPEKPETPGSPPADAPADNAPVGPPAPAPDVPDISQISFTELEHTGPIPQRQSITQPDSAEPDRPQSTRPRQDVPAFVDPTNSDGETPTDQAKLAGEPPADVRADAISLKHVTRTPFMLAIALLTAVGVVTIRRVITAR